MRNKSNNADFYRRQRIEKFLGESKGTPQFMREPTIDFLLEYEQFLDQNSKVSESEGECYV